jgi:ABC-type amino acid transport substrate-binding protein
MVGVHKQIGLGMILIVAMGFFVFQPGLAQEISLRVGITPDYPPLIFKQGDTIAGIEADLARKLGQELNRPVLFVSQRWDDQIPALLAKTTDIIMSGMSVTPAREIRIRFSEPYLKNRLLAAFRVEDAKKFDSRDRILGSFATIGAVRDTTGDAFLKRNFPNAIRKTVFPKASDAAFELKRRAVDIFIHDAPYIFWLVSENEADLTVLLEAFDEENLAWGLRKDDDGLFTRVNQILKKWKQDGTLQAVLARWLPAPYLKRFL